MRLPQKQMFLEMSFFPFYYLSRIILVVEYEKDYIGVGGAVKGNL